MEQETFKIKGEFLLGMILSQMAIKVMIVI